MGFLGPRIICDLPRCISKYGRTMKKDDIDDGSDDNTEQCFDDRGRGKLGGGATTAAGMTGDEDHHQQAFLLGLRS